MSGFGRLILIYSLAVQGFLVETSTFYSSCSYVLYASWHLVLPGSKCSLLGFACFFLQHVTCLFLVSSTSILFLDRKFSVKRLSLLVYVMTKKLFQ